MMKLVTLIAAVLLFASSVSAHSWIWCTDYETQNPGQNPQGRQETDPARQFFDPSRCNGYPPNFDSAFFDPTNSETFGTDFGFENRPGRNEMCLARPNTYSSRLPMATYQAGQIVTVVYPAKNHVAAESTNPFIPDAGVSVYMAPLGSTVQNTNFPSNADFRRNGALTDFNLIHQNGVIDFLGFQNCPDFGRGPGGSLTNSANQDRVTCTMDFQLPANMEPGEYFFAWHWEFNTNEFYSTCWSAQVTADGVTRPPPSSTSRVSTTTRRTQPPRTDATRPIVTVDGAQCTIDGRALCSKGLTPPRGQCVVTDANNPATGFVCQCADGFVDVNNNQNCLLESGVRVRIVLNVEFSLITDFDVFERALEIELSERVGVAENRLFITFSEGTEGDETGLVVAILTVAGASDRGEIGAQAVFDALMDTTNGAVGSHNFGAFSNAVSIRCLDCEASPNQPNNENASSLVAPSLFLVAAAAISSLFN